MVVGGYLEAKCSSKSEIGFLASSSPEASYMGHREKKRMAGPSWCPLCKYEEENTTHLFVLCQYVRKVWEVIISLLKGKEQLSHKNLEEWYFNWKKSQLAVIMVQILVFLFILYVGK
jgi:hypothetical protein